jgi:class 3 adenylate cyclase
MAVTGLPEAAPETHAALMADFALQLAPRLAAACATLRLPHGTLRLRTGIHSGSVTAGVLRTDRSRFQARTCACVHAACCSAHSSD